jgi:glycerophosphoryl diester phosphodiesterase
MRFFPLFSILLLLILIVVNSTANAEIFCIAHQGSFKNAPKNSLQSLQAALDLGADGVEFDIRHTLDGEAIVMHDGKLNTATHLPGKKCPLDKKINQLLLKEIKENCALEFQGFYYPIPSLEEALDLVAPSEKFVFIELKDRPGTKTVEIIKAHFQSTPDKLKIISFKIKNLDTFFSYDPDKFWENVSGLDLDVAPWGTPSRYGVNVWNRTYPLRINYHSNKKEISVWTVNRQKRIEKYLNRHIQYITTDEVELCLRLKNG